MSSQSRPQKQEHMVRAPLDCEDSDALTPKNLPAVTLSTNGGRTVLPFQTATDTRLSGRSVPMMNRVIRNVFYPVRTNLKTLSRVTEKKTTDQGAAEKVMQNELIRIGDHVATLMSNSKRTEDDKASFWDFVAAHWPVTETKGSQIKSMYEVIKRQMQITEENCDSEPFLKTGLGRLAPEIREQIFSNLLAFSPPYPGREYRVKQTVIDGRSPMSLDTFVHLKASCLTVLQTCRQIYLEAFPIFYASRSYYLANAQELQIFLKFGLSVSIGPRQFRADMITSLCLKDLLRNVPEWTPEIIEYLIPQSHPHSREQLEAERAHRIDPDLNCVDLGSMRCLRKICLCMRVGQELEYLEFLFKIHGLEHGVVDVLDNIHWTIRSQNVKEDPRKLHYSAFLYDSVRSIKNMEDLDSVNISRRALFIATRASDLVKGDERWVEVEIGSRNYEERMSKIRDISNEIEIDSLDPNRCDARTRTQSKEYGRHENWTRPTNLQGKKPAADTSQEAFKQGLRAIHQRQLRSRRRAPPPTQNLWKERRGIPILESEKEINTKALGKTKVSPNTQQSDRKRTKPLLLENPGIGLVLAENDSSSSLKRDSTWTLLMKRCLNVGLRCAALMLAMYLFYVVLCAKLEETLGQLLALLLGVLIALVAFSSTSG